MNSLCVREHLLIELEWRLITLNPKALCPQYVSSHLPPPHSPFFLSLSHHQPCQLQLQTTNFSSTLRELYLSRTRYHDCYLLDKLDLLNRHSS